MPRLELRPLRLSDAPYAILEHAHWVPFSAGLSEKFRPKQSESAPDEKLFMRLRRLCRNQEVWLSHALECVLLGCGPSLLGEVFGGASASPDRCGLYQADWPGLNRDVGVPDLIVIRGTTLYLVEIKSGTKEMQNIVLAYACTIHKVQGSEYPCVVSIIHKTHTYMLSRNLIYTAATRARKTAILIGDRLGMRRAIQNTTSIERRTWLSLTGQGAAD